MSATNIVETIKRRFGVLAGTAIGLLVGILILYACDNERVSGGSKDCVEKPSCENYTNKSDCKTAFIVERFPKGCVSDEESHTNCSSDTVFCWQPVGCKWDDNWRYCEEDLEKRTGEPQFATKFYQEDCIGTSGDDSSDGSGD